jgi:hypothetical protein
VQQTKPFDYAGYSGPEADEDVLARARGQDTSRKKSALERMRELEPPDRPQPNWLQRLGAMALGAAAGYVNARGRSYIPPEQVAEAEQGILAPGYAGEVADYQRQQQALQSEAALEMQQEQMEGLKEQRAATAEERRRKAENYAAALKEKKEEAAAKLKELDDVQTRKFIEDQMGDRKGAALYQKFSDARPTDYIFIENPKQAGWGWTLPSPLVSVTEDMLPFAPGRKLNDTVPWSEAQDIKKAVRTSLQNQAKQEGKMPSTQEQLLDAAALGAARQAGIAVDATKPILRQLPVALQAKVAEDYRRDPNAEATRALANELTQLRIDQMRQQNQPVDIQPGTPEYKVAQGLAYGMLTFPQFRTLYAYSRDAKKREALYAKAVDMNPNFNPAAFEMGFTLAKNPRVQQQLASLDNVQQGVPDLLRFSDDATRAGATLLNKFIVPGGIAVGGRKYSDFNTAISAFADELSGALGFGSATDMSREMGYRMTDKNLSPENFRSALATVVMPFVQRKRDTLLKQMGVYGQPGMNPAAGPSPGTPKPSVVKTPKGDVDLNNFHR